MKKYASMIIVSGLLAGSTVSAEQTLSSAANNPADLAKAFQSPPEKRFTRTNIGKFYTGEHKLLPSGMLGPVTLRTAAEN